ncbi:hypothetical protein [Streptomyces sp. NPDC059819]|uniref:hypothetical protein n=1 Tax=Streptomyces sp. NPDC059819 TaxID=3346963 RepID=UPI0036492A06
MDSLSNAADVEYATETYTDQRASPFRTEVLRTLEALHVAHAASVDRGRRRGCSTAVGESVGRAQWLEIGLTIAGIVILILR